MLYFENYTWIIELFFFFREILREDVARIVFGLLSWPEECRNGPDDYEGTPHLYLEVAGAPIDNAYVELPASPQPVSAPTSPPGTFTLEMSCAFCGLGRSNSIGSMTSYSRATSANTSKASERP